MGLWLYENRLYLLLAVATVFGYFWLSQFKERLKFKEWVLLLCSVVHTVIGVLLVKLFAFLESGEGGGMSLYGAVFFLPIVYFVFAKLSKRRVSDIFDVFTVNTVVTLLCARINCILADCCIGTVIPNTNGLRWPTREAEIVFYIVLYIFLRKKVSNAKYRGKIYPIYMMSYGVFRFIIEWMRESHIIFGFIHISHIWSLVAIVVGAIIYYILLRNNKSDAMHRKSTKKLKTI